MQADWLGVDRHRLEAIHQQFQADLEQLRRAKEGLAETAIRLKASNQQYEAANGALREELSVSTQKVEKITKALFNKDQEVENAFSYGQQHLEAAQAENTKLRKALDRAAEQGEEKVAELKRQLSEARRTSDRDTSGEQLAELTGQLYAATREQERLRGELQASAAVVAQLRAELESRAARRAWRGARAHGTVPKTGEAESARLIAARLPLTCGHRGNTYLTSLPFVSVRHHGLFTQWKSR